MRKLGILAAVLVACAAAPAAASVYLNGQNIDGVVGQRFDGCTVVIDAQGNVRIEAKGYAVKVEGGTPDPAAQLPPPTGGGTPGAGATGGAGTVATQPPFGGAATGPPGARLARRYFLVADQSVEGGTQYEVDVFINAQWIRKIQGSEGSLPFEVTRYLRPGPNRIFISAKKSIIGDRRFYGRDVWMKVVVGEGNVGGDHVMIDTPLVQLVRTAADMDDKNEEYVVEAR
jgi:hypothetical protein